MNLISGIFVYFLIWWTILFAVLPWGNTPETRPGHGHAPGAPAKPRIKLKFIATSGIAAIIWVLIFSLIKLDIISFHDIATAMMREDGLK